jgi:hypothetical protein
MPTKANSQSFIVIADKKNARIHLLLLPMTPGKEQHLP